MFCEDDNCHSVEDAKEFLKNNQATGVHPYIVPNLPEYPIIAGKYSQNSPI